MHHIKNRLKHMTAGILLVLPLFFNHVSVFASASSSEISNGVGTPPDGSPTINSAIRGGITIMSIIVGIYAVVMLMYAGYKYITATGDANKLLSAKKTMTYALIGVALVLLAQTILKVAIVKSVG